MARNPLGLLGQYPGRQLEQRASVFSASPFGYGFTNNTYKPVVSLALNNKSLLCQTSDPVANPHATLDHLGDHPYDCPAYAGLKPPIHKSRASSAQDPDGDFGSGKYVDGDITVRQRQQPPGITTGTAEHTIIDLTRDTDDEGTNFQEEYHDAVEDQQDNVFRRTYTLGKHAIKLIKKLPLPRTKEEMVTMDIMAEVNPPIVRKIIHKERRAARQAYQPVQTRDAVQPDASMYTSVHHEHNQPINRRKRRREDADDTFEEAKTRDFLVHKDTDDRAPAPKRALLGSHRVREIASSNKNARTTSENTVSGNMVLDMQNQPINQRKRRHEDAIDTSDETETRDFFVHRDTDDQASASKRRLLGSHRITRTASSKQNVKTVSGNMVPGSMEERRYIKPKSRILVASLNASKEEGNQPLSPQHTITPKQPRISGRVQKPTQPPRKSKGNDVSKAEEGSEPVRQSESVEKRRKGRL